MSFTIYQASAPVFILGLKGLITVLDKAAAHVAAKKIDPQALLQARLYPDMFPLVRQVQIACDFGKGPMARLSGTENPRFEDIEASFPELKARIARTLDFIASVPESAFAGSEDRDITVQAGPTTLQFKAEDIDGSEDRDILLQMRTGDVHFRGQDYLMFFVLPNVYFHSTTAYAILRGAGVTLGKMDYIGKP